MNADPNGGCSQAMWVNGYKTPLTSSYSPAQIVSETSGTERDRQGAGRERERQAADDLLQHTDDQRRRVGYGQLLGRI
jgi:hypothetical protein